VSGSVEAGSEPTSFEDKLVRIPSTPATATATVSSAGGVMTRLASTAGSTSCGQSSDSSKRKPADLLLPAALDNGQRSPRKLLDAGRA
jgi:hypothetical protein